MFERPKKGERAILVQIARPGIESDNDFLEFKDLARSASAEIISEVRGTRITPDPKYFIGAGKAEEVKQLVSTLEIELVLINHELSPTQERNLERLLQCRVVDRSGLILDIFAQRAQTFEGKLQVELAQLEHLSTRLVRGWTHLERQKGGIGLRGPGETQLETDRRLIRDRIKTLTKRLEKVRKNREQNRRARKKSLLPTVSLVGYTNAGKSSLFNTLTGEHIYVANKLFATLDPTMRKIDLPGSKSVILADTVGFIRNLPHHLVEAFRATLEETKEADLLLHVIDISDPYWKESVKAVEEVLQEIHASELPCIHVFNKIDKKSILPKSERKQYSTVYVSALTGQGLDLLREMIAEELFGEVVEENIYLSSTQTKTRALLYQNHAVISEEVLDDGWNLKIRLTPLERKAILE